MLRRFSGGMSGAVGLWLAMASVSLLAQVNTGTVLGTVKDAQGGVIPGATVTLISEARGTRSAPVVTNESGDFVFANVTADTYTVEVTLESFKTSQRSGVAVSPGTRDRRRHAGARGGRRHRDRRRQGRDTADSVDHAASARSAVTTAEVTNLPIATRNFADLINLTPGVVNGNRAGDSPSTGGGSNNFMMDGVSTMEPGSNRLMIAVNVESISEVKVLTSSYQAEFGRSSGLQVTAVTKSGTNRFRGSLYDVERELRLVLQQPDQHPQRRSEDDVEAAGLGLSRSAARSESRAAATSCSSSTPRSSSRAPPGNNVDPLPRADRARAAGGFLADHRQQRQSVPVHQGSAAVAGHLLGRPAEAALLRRRRRARPDSRRAASTRPGRTSSTSIRCRTSPTCRPGRTTTSSSPGPSRASRPGSPSSASTTSRSRRCAGRSSTPPGASRTSRFSDPLPGFNDTQMNDPVVPLWSATVELHPQPDDVPRGERSGTRSHRQAGCGLNGNGANFCTAGFPVNPVANRLTNGLSGLPSLFPDANIVDPSYYQFEALNEVSPANFDGTRVLLPPAFQWGGRVANAPPSNVYPGLRRLLVGQRFRGQPDQGARAATPSRPATTSRTPPSGRTRGTRSAR